MYFTLFDSTQPERTALLPTMEDPMTPTSGAAPTPPLARNRVTIPTITYSKTLLLLRLIQILLAVPILVCIIISIASSWRATFWIGHPGPLTLLTLCIPVLDCILTIFGKSSGDRDAEPDDDDGRKSRVEFSARLLFEVLLAFAWALNIVFFAARDWPRSPEVMIFGLIFTVMEVPLFITSAKEVSDMVYGKNEGGIRLAVRVD